MSAPVPSRPVLDPTQLEAVASVLVGGSVPEPDHPPRLVRIRCDCDDLEEGELELGVRELEFGDHPLDALIGFTAPSDWAAVGVLATGRAYAGVDADLDLTLDPDRRLDQPVPVITAHIVARDGSWGSAWQPIDGASEPAGSEHGTAAVALLGRAGRVDDAIRRVLGVTTAPPPATTHRLWALQWLDAIVASVAPSDHRLPPDSADVLALHPAVDAFDLPHRDLTIDAVLDATDRLVELRTWSWLRTRCVDGPSDDHHPWNEVDPVLAAWFDDGSFARWLLGCWPELPELVEAALALVGAGIAVDLVAMLEAWGLWRADLAT